MDDEEAEAALRALGDPIDWVDDTPHRSHAMIDFYEDVDGFVIVEYSIHFDTWFDQWEAITRPEYHRTWCKTLPLAKAACDYHRATGQWPINLQRQETALEWMRPVNDGGRLIKRSQRPVETAIGRGISYQIYERKRFWVTRHWEVWSGPHQCRIADGCVTTVELHAASDLPRCCPEPHTVRTFPAHAEARIACERHHATGKWE